MPPFGASGSASGLLLAFSGAVVSAAGSPDSAVLGVGGMSIDCRDFLELYLLSSIRLHI